MRRLFVSIPHKPTYENSGFTFALPFHELAVPKRGRAAREEDKKQPAVHGHSLLLPGRCWGGEGDLKRHSQNLPFVKRAIAGPSVVAVPEPLQLASTEKSRGSSEKR
jgi:hypothetical protein